MIEKDERFTLAERYVEETGVSVFLTGKAGTGKTTFLKESCGRHPNGSPSWPRPEWRPSMPAE